MLTERQFGVARIIANSQLVTSSDTEEVNNEDQHHRIVDFVLIVFHTVASAIAN